MNWKKIGANGGELEDLKVFKNKLEKLVLDGKEEILKEVNDMIEKIETDKVRDIMVCLFVFGFWFLVFLFCFFCILFEKRNVDIL